MKCKACGAEGSGNYCSNCGKQLAHPNEVFAQRRKAVMQDVKNTVRDLVGPGNGSDRIYRVAWFIASNKPEHFECLSGKETVSERSFILLQKVAADAVRIADLIHNVQIAYNEGKLAQIRLAVRKELNEKPDEIAEVVCKQPKGISEKHKKYLKRTILFLLSFALGAFTRFLLSVLFQ